MPPSAVSSSSDVNKPVASVVRVFGESRFHTDGDVIALAFCADGTLWSLDEPGVLRQWNEAGQQLTYHFLSDLETLWCFGPDARLLASASDDLAIWQVAAGRVIRALSQPSWVTALAFRGDSRLVATGHDDGIVRLWSVGQEQLLREFAHHERPISALAFSPQGNRLASAGEDKIVYIWDLESDEPLGTLVGHTDRIHALAWHPQGQRLVSGGWDTTARFWDTTTFEQVLLLNYHAPQVMALAFSPDGQFLASADSQDVIYLWDFTQSRPAARLESIQGQLLCLAFSPNGHRLASAGTGRVIHLADLRQLPSPSRKASRLAPARTSLQPQGMRLALSPDGARLASSEGPVLQVWDTTSNQALWQAEEKAVLRSLAYSPDAHWIAGGSDNASIRLWDAANQQLRATLTHYQQPDSVTALAFAPDSKTLAAASATGMAVWLWDVAHQEPVLLIPDALDGCTIEALAFHPLGGLLAVGGIDWLATGGSDGAVSVWDVAERCEVATFPGGTMSIAFHPSGRYLASTSLVKSICVWDVEGRQLMTEWTAGEENVTCLAYSPDGRWLASGGEDQTLRLWDAATGKLVSSAELNTHIQVLIFSRNSRFLFTGNGNRTCYQLDVQRLLREAAQC